MSPEDWYPCRACQANEHGAGQMLCDECEAQLEAELARRAIRTRADIMEAWKRSDPESYANFDAWARRDSVNRAETTFRFVTNLGAGDRVRLFYLRPGVHPGNNVQKHSLPYIDVSDKKWEELCKEAPNGIYESAFRLLSEKPLEMEWIQGPEGFKRYAEQYAEAVGPLFARDSILYYAQLKMPQDHRPSVDARSINSFFVSPRTATEPNAGSMTESAAIVRVTEAQVPRGPEVSSDYDIPAGYPANWNELRRTVYQRDNYTCQDRGETNMRVVAHHRVPLWDGGSNELSNLVTLCESCHDRRHVLISAERRALRRELRRSQFRWDTQTVVAAIMCVLVAAWFIAYLLAR